MFRGVLTGVCLIMIDLDTSILRPPRPDLSSCATKNQNYLKICREDRLTVKVNGKVFSYKSR